MNSKADDAVDFSVRNHRLRFTHPDVLQIWWNGHCSRNDFERILDFGDRQSAGRKYFVIAYLSQLASVEPDARKISATDPRNFKVHRIAMIGASFHVRVIMMMVTRAMELFHEEQRGRMRQFNEEADGFAWIADERKILGLEANDD